MKKFNLLIITALLLISNTGAQAQWAKLTSATYPNVDLNDVYASGDMIIAVGTDFSQFLGHIFTSKDAGMTWDTVQVRPQGYFMKTIAFKDKDTGFIAGYGSKTIFLNTTDGGNNWSWYIVDTANSGINDMHFLNDRVGVASGYGHSQFKSGQCYRTYDGGQNWNYIEKNEMGCLDTLPMDYVQFLDAQTGYGRADFLGEASILKTTDSGRSWQLIYTHSTTMTGVHFWNVNNGIMVDTHEKVYKTTDGGMSWTQTPATFPGSGSVLSSMAFMNQTTGYLVGALGRVFKTTDAGQTWTLEQKVTNEILLRVKFYDNHAYAVGYGGTVIRSEELVNNVDEVLPLDAQLNIYPNPTSEVLNISSYQGTYKNIKAELMDMSGRQLRVATANDGFVRMDVADIPAGAYIVTITADGKSTSAIVNILH